MNDLETRLRDAMTESVAAAVPRFGTSDIRRRHRGRMRRRGAIGSACATVAVAIAAVLGSGQVSLFTAGSAPAHAGSRDHRFVNKMFGWTVSYGSGMVAEPLAGNRPFPGKHIPISDDGVLIANFKPNLTSTREPATGPSTGWLRDFPARGVAVGIWFVDVLLVPPVLPPPLHDSKFPLSPASFRREPGGPGPVPRYRRFYGDGFMFYAYVWIGPHASRASRLAAWNVVRSLRFPALRPGTIWKRRFYVLGRASRYPVGSVTPFASRSIKRGGLGGPRFYLVHAQRGGFYVVEGGVKVPGMAGMCRVSYDARARQFRCPGTPWHWNRLGQPIGAGSKRAAVRALGPRVATVAQDGHVLYCPSYDYLIQAKLIGNPWS